MCVKVVLMMEELLYEEKTLSTYEEKTLSTYEEKKESDFF